MSTILLSLWLMRVLSISISSDILRLGAPAIILSMLLIFIVINRRSLPTFIQGSIFRAYLGILVVTFVASAIGYVNHLPLSASVSLLMKFVLMGGFLFLGHALVVYGKEKIALCIVAVALLLHLHIGIIGYFFDVGVIKDDIFRPTGITGRVSILANIALFACVFYGVRGMLEPKHRMLAFYFTLIAFITIVMSGTLKNLGALVGTFLIFSFLSAERKLLTSVLLIVIAVPIGYFIVFYTPIGERIMEAAIAGVDVEVKEGEKLESSLQWRVLHWKLLIDDWLARYFWTGSGLGQEVNMNALKLSSGQGYSAHSDWIKFLVELGPILFSLFIYFHYKLVKPLYLGSIKRQAFETAVFYSFIAMVIAMLAGPVYDTVSFFYCFWLLLGMVSGRIWLAEYRNKVA